MILYGLRNASYVASIDIWAFLKRTFSMILYGFYIHLKFHCWLPLGDDQLGAGPEHRRLQM